MLYIQELSLTCARNFGLFVSYFEKDGFLNNAALCSGQEVYSAMGTVN